MNVLALTLCASLASSALAADEPVSRVFVWVREASDVEMRLTASDVPSLRYLARSGTSFPEVGRTSLDEVAAAVRKAAAGARAPCREITDDGSGTAVIGEGDDNDGGKPSALDELQRRLGKPPPKQRTSDAESPPVEKPDRVDGGGSTLDRLRKRAGGKSTAGSSPPAKSRRGDFAQRAVATFDAGARFVLRVDRRSATSSDITRRDNDLGRLMRTCRVDAKAANDARRGIVAVVLIADDGTGAVVMAGRGVGRALVCRRTLNAEDIGRGLASLLRGSATKQPAWIDEALKAGGKR